MFSVCVAALNFTFQLTQLQAYLIPWYIFVNFRCFLACNFSITHFYSFYGSNFVEAHEDFYHKLSRIFWAERKLNNFEGVLCIIPLESGQVLEAFHERRGNLNLLEHIGNQGAFETLDFSRPMGAKGGYQRRLRWVFYLRKAR